MYVWVVERAGNKDEEADGDVLYRPLAASKFLARPVIFSVSRSTE